MRFSVRQIVTTMARLGIVRQDVLSKSSAASFRTERGADQAAGECPRINQEHFHVDNPGIGPGVDAVNRLRDE